MIEEKRAMTTKSLACTWLLVSIILSACNQQQRTPTTHAPQKNKQPPTVKVASQISGLEDTSQAQAMLKRLDAEPLLACQISYKITANAVSRQAQQAPIAGVPQIELAKQDVFMRDCLALPRKLQKCLVDEYAFQQLNACQQARKDYDSKRTRLN